MQQQEQRKPDGYIRIMLFATVFLLVSLAVVTYGAQVRDIIRAAGGGITIELPAADVPAQPTKPAALDRSQEHPAFQPQRIDLAEPQPQPQESAPAPVVAPPVWANDLPACGSAPPPCAFNYSAGVDSAAEPQPNLTTGGTNFGTEGHPQKDGDLLPANAGRDAP